MWIRMIHEIEGDGDPPAEAVVEVAPLPIK